MEIPVVHSTIGGNKVIGNMAVGIRYNFSK